MAEKTAHKIVVLGAGAVGKSAITIRMVANEWRKEYDPTIEDSYTFNTAGQEQFAALQDHWIREAEAFVLVYSVQSQRTFKHADDLHKKILRNKDGQRIDMILVGNKSDLPISEHQVTYDMGKQLADTWNVPFLETSAKTGDNVYEAFETLIKQIYKEKPRTGSIDEDMYDSQGSGCSCTIL